MEKRTHSRRNTPHRINVLAASDDQVLGRLVNITSGGLMFLTSREFAPGDRVALHIPLPTMSHDRTHIEVSGAVAWVGADANRKFTRVGVQFSNLGAEEGFIIETILQRLHLVG